jgi:hypothetical protein
MAGATFRTSRGFAAAPDTLPNPATAATPMAIIDRWTLVIPVTQPDGRDVSQDQRRGPDDRALVLVFL